MGSFRLAGGLAFTVCLSAIPIIASAQQDNVFGVPPSAETRGAITSLDAKGDTVTKGDKGAVEYRSVTVPAGTPGSAAVNSDAPVQVPFVVPNSMVLTLRPDVKAEEIDALIKERALTVLEIYENLNAIRVQTDLSKFFQPELGDNDMNHTLLRGAVEASESFKADERIIGASPETMFSNQANHEPAAAAPLQPDSSLGPGLLPQVESLIMPSAGEGEKTDWGISDIEADALWSVPGAGDGIVLGVMDTGFNRHEDLTFSGIGNQEVSDHGNHVAGIACSRHNEIGVRGVLPNCFVMPRSGDVFPIAAEGGDILQFMTRFSMIMRTLDEFVEASDEGVKVYNVSLGYNWISNFGVNIDEEEQGLYRQLVALQGENLLNALARADENGAIVVSAAGNDSSLLANPIHAKFASPFNWASITARERGIAKSGLIIEAHDQQGNRARFSNKGGDLSCPGVNVLSTVARNSEGAPASNAYGTMSGTSMASPYCAAGAALLSLVRKGYTASELVQCLTTSNEKSDSGAPRLKLSQALAACPPRN
ncbi:MAG: hypothetical protein EOS21_32505 [Mesorhizobium sp.]|nr:MAG: hypothetical protein EOS21_32505 [Mesorhizobium sp.]